MPFNTTPVPGLLIFEPRVFEDSRGYFFESYNQQTFATEGITTQWVQDNQSASSYGVVRGLHFQVAPHPQTKLVRVLDGVIWDVAVDIRSGSPTYGKWYGVELSSENKLQLYIPAGFAHGFSVLSEKATVLYKCDQLYNKASERGIKFDDSSLNIDWKIPVEKMILSEKDQENPTLAASTESYFNF